MFFKKNPFKSNIDFIVVGLGNPGKTYDGTRHNVGFRVIDKFCSQLNINVSKNKFDALCADVVINQKKILLMKPQTFMNNSGIAISEAMRFYKVPIENVIVIFDDISLPIGKIRIRKNGSAGGHNGIKSIISLCGSDKFPRIKVGVGQKPNQNWDLANWVLSKIPEEDLSNMDTAIKNSCIALEMIIEGNIDNAMNQFNRKS